MNKKKTQNPSHTQELRDSLGGPPDAPILGAGNILLIAKLTDWQLNALLNVINDRQDHTIRH